MPIYGFDSFEGLPDAWIPGFPKGYFNMDGKLPPVAPNVVLVKGWFDETLPPFVQQHPEPVSYLHIDCDMYESTKTVFQNLAPRIVPGTVIVFDELVNYPGYQDHELKAFYEFLVPLNAAKRLQADSMRQLKTLFYSSEPQFKHTS